MLKAYAIDLVLATTTPVNEKNVAYQSVDQQRDTVTQLQHGAKRKPGGGTASGGMGF